MSLLTIHSENHPESAEIVQDFNAISKLLEELDVKFERWSANCELDADADQETVLSAYATQVEFLKSRYGFKSVDVIAITPDHPQKQQLREKFLSEHTHDDFEVRFFVEGSGLFYLHPDENVYVVLCEKGDLISVPANTKHWFDMGANPNLKCIRLFTTPDGWVAEFTGNLIANYFPKYEQFLKEYA